MSELTDKALAWLKEAVDQAIAEAQTGNTHLLNALGYHPGAQYYINNVHGRPEAVLIQWKQWHESHMRDVERLYEAYQQQRALVEAAEKVAALEAQVATLTDAVRALTEAKVAAAAEADEPAAPEPDAPAELVADEQPQRKGKKAPKGAEEAEPPAETNAEGEPEKVE